MRRFFKWSGVLVFSILAVSIMSAPLPPIPSNDFTGDVSITGNLSLTGNITVPNNGWVGLGASAGRIIYNDEATDVLGFPNCNVSIGGNLANNKLVVTDDAGQTFLEVSDTLDSEFVYLGISATDGRVVGTTQNADFSLWTSGQRRMVVDGGGDIGIGTNDPAGDLHVVDDTESATIIIETTDTVDEPILAIKANRPTDGTTACNVQFWNDGNLVNYILSRVGSTTAKGDLGFYVSDAVAMYIDEDRKVGIKDATPSYTLDVDGTLRVTGKATFDGGTDPPYGHFWETDRHAVTNRVAHEVPPSKYNGMVIAYCEDSDEVFFWQPSSGKWFRIRFSGGGIAYGSAPAWTENKAKHEWRWEYRVCALTGNVVSNQVAVNPDTYGLKEGYWIDEDTGICYDPQTNVVASSEAIELK